MWLDNKSKYRYYNDHVKKYRVKEHYNQKKLAKLASMQVAIGNLEVEK